MAPIELKQINTVPKERFVELLGSVFERSPWIAERAFEQRPFASVAALHSAMVLAVQWASHAEQLALICAHPELAGAAADTLTAASAAEQARAGLNHCTPEELTEIDRLNGLYRERFGFPFIMAVQGRSKLAIMQSMATRLTHSEEEEFAQALMQIAKITRLRLDRLVVEPPP